MNSMPRNRKRKAIITGIAGQDGSYLAELLLGKGYEVLGFVKKDDPVELLRPIIQQLNIEETKQQEFESMNRTIRSFSPHEIYNFAAVSFIPASWDDPLGTLETNTILATRLLETFRVACPTARFYQASSSEIFGKPIASPQDENTLFQPATPYGVSKLATHLLAGLYRERYRLYVSCGILYNHESPRRPGHFVMQKIARAAAEVSLGTVKRFHLGNIEARRDWGFAGDYVRGIWLMLQQETPDDYVLGTGETHSVRNILEIAFTYVGGHWEQWVDTDPEMIRPVEVGNLVANPERARSRLGWVPIIPFPDLVRMMVDAQREKLRIAGKNP